MAKMLVRDLSRFLNTSNQSIHQKLKRMDLTTSKESNLTQISPEDVKKIMGINYDPMIISIAALKGGSGKSTISQNLAVRASMLGNRVLIIDLDQQGNVSSVFKQLAGIEYSNYKTIFSFLSNTDPNKKFEDIIVSVQPGLDIIQSNMENSMLDFLFDRKSYPLDRVFRDRLRPLLGVKYDLIVIDNAPALTKSVAAAILSSDLVISPVNPALFDLSGLRVISEYIGEYIQDVFKVGVNMRILLNKTDNRTLLSKDVREQLLAHPNFGSKIMHSQIRLCQAFPNSQRKRESVFDDTKESTAREDIDSLVREIFNMDEKIAKNQRSYNRKEADNPTVEV
jgi:chromosome partitioning protein